jgi:hypothetical protein
MRPWSTARRRVSGSAHAFVEVTRRRLRADLQPSQQCVSNSESESQDLDRPPVLWLATGLRTSRCHVFVIVLRQPSAASKRRQDLNSYRLSERPFQICRVGRQSIDQHRTCFDHPVEVRIRPLLTGESERFSDRSGVNFFLGDSRGSLCSSPEMNRNGHHCVSLRHALRPFSGWAEG